MISNKTFSIKNNLWSTYEDLNKFNSYQNLSNMNFNKLLDVNNKYKLAYLIKFIWLINKLFCYYNNSVFTISIDKVKRYLTNIVNLRDTNIDQIAEDLINISINGVTTEQISNLFNNSNSITDNSMSEDAKDFITKDLQLSLTCIKLDKVDIDKFSDNIATDNDFHVELNMYFNDNLSIQLSNPEILLKEIKVCSSLDCNGNIQNPQLIMQLLRDWYIIIEKNQFKNLVVHVIEIFKGLNNFGEVRESLNILKLLEDYKDVLADEFKALLINIIRLFSNIGESGLILDFDKAKLLLKKYQTLIDGDLKILLMNLMDSASYVNKDGETKESEKLMELIKEYRWLFSHNEFKYLVLSKINLFSRSNNSGDVIDANKLIKLLDFYKDIFSNIEFKQIVSNTINIFSSLYGYANMREKEYFHLLLKKYQGIFSPDEYKHLLIQNIEKFRISNKYNYDSNLLEYIDLLRKYKDVIADDLKIIIPDAIMFFSSLDNFKIGREADIVMYLLDEYKDLLIGDHFQYLLINIINNFSEIKNNEVREPENLIILLKDYKNIIDKHELKNIVFNVIKSLSIRTKSIYGRRYVLEIIALLKDHRDIMAPDELKNVVIDTIKFFLIIDEFGMTEEVGGVLELLKEYKYVIGDQFRLIFSDVIEAFSSQDGNGKIRYSKIVMQLLEEYKELISQDFKLLVMNTIKAFSSLTNNEIISEPSKVVILLKLYKDLLGNDLKMVIVDTIKIFSSFKKCGSIQEPTKVIELLKFFIDIFTVEEFKMIIESINPKLELDLWFNHINNYHTGSLLTVINDMQKIEHKKLFMEVVITYLDQCDILTIGNAIKTIILSNKCYLESKIIVDFIIHKILSQIIIDANHKIIKFNYLELELLLQYINNFVTKNDFMLKNSNLINQMIYFGRNLHKIETKDLKIALKDLEDNYLNLPDFINIKHEIEVLGMFDEYSFIFISSDLKHKLVINNDYYKKWLLNEDIDISVDNAIWYNEHNKNLAITKPLELFGIFTLFASGYNYLKSISQFVTVIDLLQLNNEDKKYFIDALKTNRLDYNPFIDPNNSNIIMDSVIVRFDSVFTKILSGYGSNINLNINHFHDILNIYDFNNSNNKEQAQLLLGLSSIFTKYSSSRFFGTESDSIPALRGYSLALLNKSYELDPNIVNFNLYKDWKSRFLGEIFSCTGIIFDSMSLNIRHNFPNILNVVLPPFWQ